LKIAISFSAFILPPLMFWLLIDYSVIIGYNKDYRNKFMLSRLERYKLYEPDFDKKLKLLGEQSRRVTKTEGLVKKCRI